MIFKLINTSRKKSCIALIPFFLILGVITSCTHEISSRSSEDVVSLDSLKRGFLNPPEQVKPYTWWHWMNGNITKEGITKDLEWMKAYGIGGAVVFNVGMLGDDLPRKVPFGTDKWWGMVDHAIAEADRLGLKLGFHNCDGWSHSGGPWMDVEHSMKKMVWTEKVVREGEKDILLDQPETLLNYYKDIATLAFPVKDINLGVKDVSVTSNQKDLNSSVLLDDEASTCIEWHDVRGKSPVWVDFAFSEPRDIASVTLGINAMKKLKLSIEVSVDGNGYKEIETFNSHSKGILGWRLQNMPALTFSFPHEKIQNIRVNVIECQGFTLSGIQFSESAKVNNWEIKAAHVYYAEHGAATEYHYPDLKRWYETDAIQTDDIVNLTDKLGDDNRLDWIPPNGKWKIIRIGQTTNGKTNGPSTVEGRGLEADKLNPEALTIHYNGFMKKLVGRDINKTTNSLEYSEIDSWEAGAQNWTDEFLQEFRKLNGYDMEPFLPVITNGYVIGNYEISERFLWDYRKTLAHLIRTGCFGTLQKKLNEDGMTVFAEGSGRQAFMYDPINYQSTADIPKGEFWVGGDMGANLPADKPSGFNRPRIDCKVAASVAHIYGKKLAASESYTGGRPTFEQGPFDIKMIGDKAFCMGVNWIVLHTSAHQPYDVFKPGFSLGGAGSHFHRNNIVHEENYGWLDYIARCQYLLRQGNFVADVLCYLGEDVPNYLGFRNELSVPLPEGYDYDGCNAEIILDHTTVKNGKIILDSGMEYRYLLLPENPAISLPVLQKLEQLVKMGATVIGQKPTRSYGLKSYQEKDQAIANLANKLWGNCNGTSVKEHLYGKGKVIWGKSFDEIATSDNLIPDFHFETDSENPDINYIHRKTGETDIYFIANGNYRKDLINARFRVKNKRPELFIPGTGEVVKSAKYKVSEDVVEMTIELAEAGSVFVVFTPDNESPSIVKVEGKGLVEAVCKKAGNFQLEFHESGDYSFELSNGKKKLVKTEVPLPIILDGIWQIHFPLYEGLGKTIEQPLFAWNKSQDFDIKHFSGTAIYKKVFQLPEGYLQENQKLYLDLGDVQEIAEVIVNGKTCAKLWKAPYKTDISAFVVKGENTIEIKVTNTITNRMIGDEYLPKDVQYNGRYISDIPVWLNDKNMRKSNRVTFALSPFYNKNSGLIDSGLIGPVSIKLTSLKVLNGFN